MNNSFNKSTRLYLVCIGLFWLVFGVITTLYPKLMNLFQADEGINKLFSGNTYLYLKHV